MTKKIIRASKNLPFSKAIIHNQKYILEISGQVGLDENNNLKSGIEEQTKQIIKNIKTILREVGWNLENLIKVRIFLTEMKNYQIVNEIYSEYFNKNFPTRITLAVKELPLNALIEIDCTASGEIIKNN